MILSQYLNNIYSRSVLKYNYIYILFYSSEGNIYRGGLEPHVKDLCDYWLFILFFI